MEPSPCKKPRSQCRQSRAFDVLLRDQLGQLQHYWHMAGVPSFYGLVVALLGLQSVFAVTEDFTFYKTGFSRTGVSRYKHRAVFLTKLSCHGAFGAGIAFE